MFSVQDNITHIDPVYLSICCVGVFVVLTNNYERVVVQHIAKFFNAI